MPDLFVTLAIAALGVLTLAIILAFASTTFAHGPHKPSGDTSALDRAIDSLVEPLRHLPYEVGYALAPDGTTLVTNTQYHRREVDFTPEQITYLRDHPGAVGVHNHNADIPPSGQDLRFAATVCYSATVIISPNYRYTITPPTSGWKTHDELNAAFSRHLGLFKVTLRKLKPRGIDPRDGAILTESEFEIESTEAGIQTVCRELGYTYRKEKLAPQPSK